MRIGFFDSGLGGLTVLNEAKRLLPHEPFVYFADTRHVPYGTKSKEEVKRYVFEAVEMLESYDLKALVVACNTATSIAIEDLRAVYDFPIIGMEPAVKPAVESIKPLHKRVLVTATPLTLRESKFQQLVAKIDEDHLVDSLPLPELVEFCERLEFDEQVIVPYLKDRLSGYDLDQYGAVVLGCTHFPFFRDHFRHILPDHIAVMDGSLGTVNRLIHVLKERNALYDSGSSDIIWLTSGGCPEETEYLRKAWAILQKETPSNV
jgi:glutamate racemase